jgi:hypothetical protein
MHRTRKPILTVVIALGIWATGIVEAKTLKEVQSDLKVGRQPLIESYTVDVEKRSAHIQLNPYAWNALSESGKFQIYADLLATNFVDDMGLSTAWFRVGDKGIGEIRRESNGNTRWDLAR